MIEKTILDYLSSNMDVEVHMERPEKPPEKYVLIEKTGSSKKNHICRSTLTIQSYAGSMYEAAGLNEVVKRFMEEAITMGDIAKVSLNSDYNFTDTVMKHYRYQAVFDITHY